MVGSNQISMLMSSYRPMKISKGGQKYLEKTKWKSRIKNLLDFNPSALCGFEFFQLVFYEQA